MPTTHSDQLTTDHWPHHGTGLASPCQVRYRPLLLGDGCFCRIGLRLQARWGPGGPEGRWTGVWLPTGEAIQL